jgi:hypothetical protein
MDGQRFVSDMQSHHVLFSGSGSEAGAAAAADDSVDNVVALFAPRAGSVAALIAAASGPAEDHELLGESEIRATFRAAMLERPLPGTHRRHRKLAPLAIAAGSVVGLIAGTAGLSAAAVLPPAANHVVARVLAQVGIDVAPTSKAVPSTLANHGVSLPAIGSPAVKPSHSKSAPPSSTANAHTPAAAVAPPTHVVRTCNVSVTVNGVQSNAQIQVTASNAASALAATPPIKAKGHCSLNRGTPSTGTPASGKGTGGGTTTGGGAGTGSGTGTGTGSGKGTLKGGGKGHHGKGHHGKHGGQGGTGTGTGTGTVTGSGSGTDGSPLGDPTTTTVPSTGPVTSDAPLGPTS